MKIYPHPSVSRNGTLLCKHLPCLACVGVSSTPRKWRVSPACSFSTQSDYTHVQGQPEYLDGHHSSHGSAPLEVTIELIILQRLKSGLLVLGEMCLFFQIHQSYCSSLELCITAWHWGQLGRSGVCVCSESAK